MALRILAGSRAASLRTHARPTVDRYGNGATVINDRSLTRSSASSVMAADGRPTRMIDRSDVEQWDRDYLIHVEHRRPSMTQPKSSRRTERGSSSPTAGGCWTSTASTCASASATATRGCAPLCTRQSTSSITSARRSPTRKARAGSCCLRHDGRLGLGGAAKFTASGSEAVECAPLMARVDMDRRWQ